MEKILLNLVELLNVPPFCDENGDSTLDDLLKTIFWSQNFNWLMEHKPKETKELVEQMFRLKI